MDLLAYLQISADELQLMINRGYIETAHHAKFPLVMFTYSRKTVADNTWPESVRKCRGLIVREDTNEIIARPFEKFFNYGDPVGGYPDNGPGHEPDSIVEKMDGFLCTMYRWEDNEYI